MNLPHFQAVKKSQNSYSRAKAQTPVSLSFSFVSETHTTHDPFPLEEISPAEYPENREEILQSIKKQLAILKDRSKRMKFYVEEMINALPTED